MRKGLIIFISFFAFYLFSQEDKAKKDFPVLPDIEDIFEEEKKKNNASESSAKEKAVVGGELPEEKKAKRAKAKRKVLYKWGVPPDVEYDSFLVEIYRDNLLKELVKKKKTRKNQVSIKMQEDETLYIRVAIKTKKGLVSDFSNLSKVVFSPEIEIKKKPKKKYAMGMFYAASTGRFQETAPNGVGVVEDQNSPLTIGVNASYPLNELWTTYSSLYISYFSQIELTLNNSVKNPPFEYGFNAYAQRKMDFWEGFYLYTGVDFEIFTTFNTDQLSSISSELDFRSQNMFFLTGGLQKNFKLFDKFSFIKFSISPIIFSSGDASPINGENYNGFKYIFYLHYSLVKRWGTGFFFKQHHLSGAGDLVVTRYGFNISYRLF